MRQNHLVLYAYCNRNTEEFGRLKPVQRNPPRVADGYLGRLGTRQKAQTTYKTGCSHREYYESRLEEQIEVLYGLKQGFISSSRSLFRPR